MTANYDFLKHTNLFGKKEQIEKVEKISSKKLKIITSEGKTYALSLYDIERLDDINSESFIQQRLRELGLKSLEIYEEGILPDIKKSYKIFQYRKELSLKQFLDQANTDDKFKLGYNFGEILKRFHESKIGKTVDWEKEFLTKTNYLFYMHGLSDRSTDKDYILIDHIKDNIHLTKNTTTNLLHGNINDKNIRVYGDMKLDLRGIKEISLGDGIFDFVDINRIAIDSEDFARGVLSGYFNNKKPGKKFFRLLSLYQSYVILYSQINQTVEKNYYLNEDQRIAISRMYDDFNEIIPSWVR